MTQVAPASRVAIVVVNYRAAELVIDCLRSLVDELAALDGSRVVVVDNDSADDSAQRITDVIEKENFGQWASVLSLDKNGGFSCGNNAAISKLLEHDDPPDFVLLLNPDTWIRPGAVKALLQFMAEHPKVGIAGSRLEDPDGKVQPTGHPFPHPMGELSRGARLGLLDRMMHRYTDTFPNLQEPKPYDWVSGASMIIRREVLENVGLLDEGYFLYFDEVDYCYRACHCGWQVWYVPQSRVVHLEGTSTNIKAARQRRKQYWYESRRRFFVKAYGITGLVMADVLWAIGRFTLACRRLVGLGGDLKNDPGWFAYDLLWGDLVALVKGRLRTIRRS